MFGRAALRVASQRVLRPTTLTPILSHATFGSSSKVSDPEVPVVSYHKGERSEQIIKYDESEIGPVTPPGTDETKTAVPLKQDALRHLTPTLRKFTLPGKVAVVTG